MKPNERGSLNKKTFNGAYGFTGLELMTVKQRHTEAGMCKNSHLKQHAGGRKLT